jgi:hypothetical protein
MILQPSRPPTPAISLLFPLCDLRDLGAMLSHFAWSAPGSPGVHQPPCYRKIARYATGSKNRKIATPAAQTIKRRTSLRDTFRPD